MSDHAVKVALPSPIHVIIDNQHPLPSPLPSPFHVVLDPSVHGTWWTTWTTNDWLTVMLVIATVALGVAALGTIIANDLTTQERTLPHCDLEAVDEYRILPDGEQLGVGFTLRNDGTGPAREVRLHLEEYAGQKVGESVYLGGIAPGQTRRYSDKCGNEQRFKLPARPGGYRIMAHDADKKSCIFLLTYYSMRGDLGDAYVEERLKSDHILKRKRTTPPLPARRGFAFLLWIILGVPRFRATTSDNDLKAKREALRRSLGF